MIILQDKVLQPIVIAGDRVTFEEVSASIVETKYIRAGKITVCHLTLKDGYEVIGTAGVVNPANFDMNTGQGIAYNKALDKVWQHLGSILQTQMASKKVE
jgi:hypothetical protein